MTAGPRPGRYSFRTQMWADGTPCYPVGYDLDVETEAGVKRGWMTVVHMPSEADASELVRELNEHLDEESVEQLQEEESSWGA